MSSFRRIGYYEEEGRPGIDGRANPKLKTMQ